MRDDIDVCSPNRSFVALRRALDWKFHLTSQRRVGPEVVVSHACTRRYLILNLPGFMVHIYFILGPVIQAPHAPGPCSLERWQEEKLSGSRR